MARNTKFYLLFCMTTMALLISLSGCLQTDDLKGSDAPSAAGNSSKTFNGCIGGTGIDASQIQVNFEFPSDADRVKVYRNGNQVYSSTNHGALTFTDTSLSEGVQYEYSCELVYGAKSYLGQNVLTVATVSTSAPVFSGAISVQKVSTSSARVNWAVPSTAGPSAGTYKVYYNPGTSVNWSLSAKATVGAGTYQKLLTGLGDQMPYAFGVRACTISSVCDSNTALAATIMDQGGAPTTMGVVSAAVVNGAAVLQVPWADSMGAVQNRYVYQRTGATGGTNLGLYTLVRTITVSDLTNVSSQISIAGLSENTTYWFIVQDADPLAVSNNNLNPVSITTGDLQPPVFSGINSLSLGSPADQSLLINFTAIAREGTADSGAINGTSYYNIYTTSAAYPATPADPCTSGFLWGMSSQLAAPYAPGAQSITLTGLSARTTYRVCLKALDAAGNISTNTDNLSITTRDLTAPTFDGIQTISFNASDSKIYLTWNASPTSDTAEYRVKLWKNTTTPTAGQITTFFRTSGSSATGTLFALTEYSFSNLDTVYAVVDACDDAQVIPGGTKNCGVYATNTAKNVALPAFLPPQGFPGIKASSFQISTVQGVATIAWSPPTSWTPDYTGFKIYSVNPSTNAITALRSCPCVTPGSCNNSDTSCSVSGLAPGRTYRFHVRAYNSGNFESTYLDPALSYADKKVADTTAPTFNSGLTIGVAPTYVLNWAAATDDQYTGDGATINYKVYRKANSTFTTATNPAASGLLVATTTATTYSDSGWLDGTTYYYAVCALDSSSNTTCDGTVQSISVTDVTAPTITSFTTLKTSQAALKRWDLNWTMADNTTSASALRVRLYRSATASQTLATTSDSLIVDSVGDTALTAEIGPMNQTKYINYLLWVQDAAGNIATRNLSVLSSNAVTLNNVQRNTGTTGGGQLIIITGTGFSKGTTNGFGTSTGITLAGGACSSVDVINSTLMSCITSTGINGPAVVELTNPEGSSTTQAGLFTYLSSSSEVCDNPGTWGTGMAAGTGIVSDPFIICNGTQLNKIRYKISDGYPYNYIDGNYYFKLGANINLNGVTFPSLGGESSGRGFTGSFDGSNYSVLNWTRTSTASSTGFFGSGTGITVRNLKLLNAAVSSNETNTAMLLGYGFGVTVLDNITLTGSAISSRATGACCENAIGGLIGGHLGTTLSISNITMTATVTSNGEKVAGIVGTYSGSGTVTITNIVADLIVRSAGNQLFGFGSFGLSNGTHTFSNIIVRGFADSDITYGSGGAGVGFGTYSVSPTINISRFGILMETNHLGGSGGLTGAFNVYIANGAPIYNISESYFSGSANYASYGNSYNFSFLRISGAASAATMNLTDSYTRGDLAAGSNYAPFFTSSNISNITNFFSATTLTGGYASNGVATGTATTAAVNSFWDYALAGRLTTEYGTLAMTSKTTTQMKNQGTNIYSAAGWDFTPVTGKWKWCGVSDYPHLMWETCP